MNKLVFRRLEVHVGFLCVCFLYHGWNITLYRFWKVGGCCAPRVSLAGVAARESEPWSGLARRAPVGQRVTAVGLHPTLASLCQLSGGLPPPSALEPHPGPTGLARGDGSWAQGQLTAVTSVATLLASFPFSWGPRLGRGWGG